MHLTLNVHFLFRSLSQILVHVNWTDTQPLPSSYMYGLIVNNYFMYQGLQLSASFAVPLFSQLDLAVVYIFADGSTSLSSMNMSMNMECL